MNKFTFTEIQEGMSASFEKKITGEMVHSFRSLSGDDNPLHRDDDYAKQMGFQEHVVYGMLTASLYSAMAGVYLPGKYSLIHSMEIKFCKPVFEEDVLTVTGVVAEKQEALKLVRLKVKIVNQNNVCVSKADMKVLVLQ